jgi:predicted NAD-dependent protein-ADP-ribosyltransferase YbiA (DUF1768 family)
MKYLSSLFFSFIFFLNLSAQTTLTLKPNASEGKDAYIESYNTTTNYGVYPNYASIAWSGGGHDFVSRSNYILQIVDQMLDICNASHHLGMKTPLHGTINQLPLLQIR